MVSVCLIKILHSCWLEIESHLVLGNLRKSYRLQVPRLTIYLALWRLTLCTYTLILHQQMQENPDGLSSLCIAPLLSHSIFCKFKLLHFSQNTDLCLLNLVICHVLLRIIFTTLQSIMVSRQAKSIVRLFPSFL